VHAQPIAIVLGIVSDLPRGFTSRRRDRRPTSLIHVIHIQLEAGPLPRLVRSAARLSNRPYPIGADARD